MNIFEINAELMRALTMVDESTGEWIGADIYDAMELERDTKIEQTALVVKEATAEAKAIAEEIKRLQARKSSAEATAERCKGLLEYALDGAKFKSPRVAISYRKSNRTIIDSEAELFAWAQDHAPECFKVEFSPVKTEIAKLIDAGEDVAGAHIEQAKSMVIK